MKKLESKTYLRTLIITLTIFMMSCNKEEEIVPMKDDTNEILLAGTEEKTWSIVSSKVNGEEWLPYCVRDDDWIFTRSNKFKRNNTDYSCSNGFPDIDRSNWSFGHNETSLTFGGGTYEITTLTEETMVLTFPESNGDTFVDTWVKK